MGWSLDDLVAALFQGRACTLRRSSIWRIVEEADRKPHRSVSWLTSHVRDCEAKAPNRCALYMRARRFFEQGRLVLCRDAKTGMQRLARKYPTQLCFPKI